MMVERCCGVFWWWKEVVKGLRLGEGRWFLAIKVVGWRLVVIGWIYFMKDRNRRGMDLFDGIPFNVGLPR